MEKFIIEKQQNRKEETSSTTLVSNGCVNIHGHIADKQTTGGWKASPFIIVSQIAENLTYIAVVVNLVTYLLTEMQQSLPTSVTYVTAWSGFGNIFTIIGAFLADGYIGRFKTILLFSCIYSLGILVLTLSASIDSLRPPPCIMKPCTTSTLSQIAFLCGGLILMALGTGGMKPCIAPFGADQFDEADEEEVIEKSSFFDWIYFSLNMGAIFSLTVVIYVQQKMGWRWSFGLLTGIMILSIIILLVGLPYYRFQKPTGSAFTRFLQVIVVSITNHLKGVIVWNEAELYEVQTLESDIKGARKLPHTKEYKFLDKAAIVIDPEANINNRWRLCTITQVEEFKCLIRVLPIWIIGIFVSISFSQFTTFFVSQARIMDRKLTSNFSIPAASTPLIFAINSIILTPTYGNVIVPILRKFTGHPRGITSLQRIGVGIFVSVIALATAALVEKQRRDSPDPSNVSVFWLFPQFIFLATAEMFTSVGQMEFFYDEATEGTKTISSAVNGSQLGVANILSSVLVKIISNTTGGAEKGWLRNDLNKGKLDFYYGILSAINGISFLIYLWVSWHFKGRSGCVYARVQPIIEINDVQTVKIENETSCNKNTK